MEEPAPRPFSLESPGWDRVWLVAFCSSKLETSTSHLWVTHSWVVCSCLVYSRNASPPGHWLWLELPTSRFAGDFAKKN
eukprot:2555224-Amphidinium_carterae.1